MFVRSSIPLEYSDSEAAQCRCSKGCNASARARFAHPCHPRAHHKEAGQAFAEY